MRKSPDPRGNQQRQVSRGKAAVPLVVQLVDDRHSQRIGLRHPRCSAQHHGTISGGGRQRRACGGQDHESAVTGKPTR
jgi:hypothetical protein